MVIVCVVIAIRITVRIRQGVATIRIEPTDTHKCTVMVTFYYPDLVISSRQSLGSIRLCVDDFADHKLAAR